jgi:hypothetical protein
MKDLYLIMLIITLDSSLLLAQKTVSTDFESQPKGTTYSLSVWKSDSFVTNSWDNGMNARSMADDSFSVSGKKSLRIIYPKVSALPPTERKSTGFTSQHFTVEVNRIGPQPKPVIFDLTTL